MEDKQKIKTEFKKLYQEIDECITSLIRARKLHDGAAVAKAYQRMETLMVATQQDISWLLDNLQEESLVLNTQMYFDENNDLVPAIGDQRDRFSFGDKVKVVIIKVE